MSASCFWQVEQSNLHVIATNFSHTRSTFNRNKEGEMDEAFLSLSVSIFELSFALRYFYIRMS